MAPDPLVRVSIFMSVFDVHINRTPIAGTVRKIVYIAGKFLNADLDKASEENERQHILVEAEDGTRVAFTQIAGLVARRIVPWVKAGDRVLAGQRVGLIRFGSRVDVYLPAGTSSQVLLGQRTIAGETIGRQDRNLRADRRHCPMTRPPERRGIPLRAVLPNAVTALALCVGLTGVRFAIAGQWDWAVYAIVGAAILDGMDGRIARAASRPEPIRRRARFAGRRGRRSACRRRSSSTSGRCSICRASAGCSRSLYVACMALRLARFNARIDVEDQPHKSAGFFTGVPAPAGAGLLLLPLILWLASNGSWTWLRDYRLVAPWAGFVAFLVISSLATFSWTSLRLRRNIRLEAIVVIVLMGGALVSAPLETMAFAAFAYLASIPFSILSYAKVKRQRARQTAAAEPSLPLSPPLDPLPPERPARRRRSPPNES